MEKEKVEALNALEHDVSSLLRVHTIFVTWYYKQLTSEVRYGKKWNWFMIYGGRKNIKIKMQQENVT